MNKKFVQNINMVRNTNLKARKIKEKFDFTNARSMYPYLEKVEDDFLIWLIGFFEGDGSFIFSKELNIVISQREDNKHTLEMIVEKLEIGKVIVQSKNLVPGKLWIYRWVIRDLRSINIFMKILEGNLVVPMRIHKHRLFAEKHNEKLLRAKQNRPNKYKDIEPLNINKQPLKEYIESVRVWPTDKDPWFSGYSDAEGCFTVSLLSNSNAFRIRFIVAKINDERVDPCFNILGLWEHFVSDILKAGTIQKAHQKDVIDVRVNGLKNMGMIYPYFDSYLLKTNKIESYLLTKTLHQKFLDKEHLCSSKRALLAELIRLRKLD